MNSAVSFPESYSSFSASLDSGRSMPASSKIFVSRFLARSTSLLTPNQTSKLSMASYMASNAGTSFISSTYNSRPASVVGFICLIRALNSSRDLGMSLTSLV